MPTVGRSPGLTPVKLGITDKLLGQDVGAAPYIKPRRRHHFIWDMTAGDAAKPEGDFWHKGSELGYAVWHAYDSAEVPTTIFATEKDESTYRLLLGNLNAHLIPALQAGEYFREISESSWQFRSRKGQLVTLHVHNVDSRTIADDNPLRQYFRDDSVGFLLIDPNTVTHDPFRIVVQDEISRSGVWLRSMSTLICNAKGQQGNLQKVGKLQTEREAWYAQVEELRASLPPRQDLMLARVVGGMEEAAKSAFLLRTVRGWEKKTETLVRKAMKANDKDCEAAWASHPGKFTDIQDRIFLFKREREEKIQPPLF